MTLDLMAQAAKALDLFDDACGIHDSAASTYNRRVRAMAKVLETTWQKPGGAAQAQAGEKPDFPADEQSGETRRAPSPSPAPGMVTDEIAEARRRLAAWDIGALPKDMTLLEIVDARISDLQRYQNMPFSLRDIERGLILFRTSNNAHGLTNFVSLTMKVDALPQAGKDELASMMRNIAEGLSPALASLQPAKGEREGGQL